MTPMKELRFPQALLFDWLRRRRFLLRRRTQPQKSKQKAPLFHRKIPLCQHIRDLQFGMDIPTIYAWVHADTLKEPINVDAVLDNSQTRVWETRSGI